MLYKKGKLPKIDTQRNSLDQIFLLGTIGLYAFAIVYLSLIYGDLSDVVPSHMNVHGEIDGHGGKIWLWVFLIIGLIMSIPIYLLERIPHKFNYMVEITEQNAHDQYCIAISMMRYLNFTIALLWLVILNLMIKTAQGTISGSPMYWITGLLILQMLGLMYFVKLSRDHK